MCELHTGPACVLSRSHFLILRSDAGFSFERRAHNDISFRQHTSGHHGTAQRHFWPRGGREAGGIMLDTFIGEVCAPPLLSPPTVSSFFSIGVCTAACSVYRIIKELLRLPWLQHPGPGPAPSICLSLSPLPLAFPLMATALH